jgi:hypothetical protein
MTPLYCGDLEGEKPIHRFRVTVRMAGSIVAQGGSDGLEIWRMATTFCQIRPRTNKGCSSCAKFVDKAFVVRQIW